MYKNTIKKFMLIIIISVIIVSPLLAQSNVRKSFNIGFLTDIVGIKDNFYNELTWKGIIALDASNFVLGSIDYYEPQAATEYSDLLREISIFEDRDVIIVSSPQLHKSLYTVANENTDNSYIIIDGIIDNTPNVANAIFSTEQGSFVVGLIAGIKTLEDGLTKVGFIGDVDTKERQQYESGFEQGVKTASEDLEIEIVYLDEQGVDLTRAEEHAKTMFTNGVGIIYNAASFAGEGIFNVAKEITQVFTREQRQRVPESKRTYANRAWVIGTDRDQFKDGIYSADSSGVFLSLSVTLTSMIKRFDTASKDMLTRSYNFNFPAGQVIYYNLANDGVGLPPLNPNLNFPYADQLQEAIAPIIAGEKTVPKTPVRILQSFQ